MKTKLQETLDHAVWNLSNGFNKAKELLIVKAVLDTGTMEGFYWKEYVGMPKVELRRNYGNEDIFVGSVEIIYHETQISVITTSTL